MQTSSVSITPSLRAFMANLIDYAGLFPPAKLPLRDAIHNYARYRQSPDRWMLSRFVIPAVQLGELSAFGDLFQEDEPFRFSVLGRGGQDTEEFITGLEADVDAISSFRQKHRSSVSVDVLEVKLPASLTASNKVSKIVELISKAEEMLDSDREIESYYEVVFDPAWDQAMRATIEAIAKYNAKHNHQVGFKLRCGGVETSAFPTAAQIALALLSCQDAGISLKATAGLHHPIRRFDPSVETKMHGFLNVFGAGTLAQIHNFNQMQTLTILEDEQTAHFRFGSSEFAWNGVQASTGEISAIRKSALTSFGSCSFDEPREDLEALGLLPRSAVETI